MKLLLIALVLLTAVEVGAQGSTNVTHTVVAVGGTSTAVSTRTNRRFIVLQNISDDTISCKFTEAAVVSEGIVLNPQPAAGQAGGSFVFDLTVPVGQLNCIGSTAGGNVLLTEG